MVDFGAYLLESSMCLAGFYIVYMLFLANDTFVIRNRIFLVFATIASLIIPVLNVQLTGETATLANHFVWELEHSIDDRMNLQTFEKPYNQSMSFLSVLFLVYLTGSLFLLFRIILHVFYLVKSIIAYDVETCNDLKIVSVNENSSPYSFFRYVFLNKELIPLSEQKNVLLHESIHARQYHSVDLLLVEFVSILLWFNPFIYLLKRSLIETHEYLADKECLKQGVDKFQYQNALLRIVESQMIHPLTSSFNSSLTVKRIKMIKKIKTSRLAHLKLIFVLPVVLLSLLSFSYTEQSDKFHIGNFEGYYPSGDFSFPLESGNNIYISSEYGDRLHPVRKKTSFHKGIDVAAPTGTSIHAISDGIVRKVNSKFKEGKGYGRFVVIEHRNGYGSLYSQMNSYSVKEGQKVKKGDVIGTIGSSGLSTGSHLHFELKKDGENVNPLEYFTMDLSVFRR